MHLKLIIPVVGLVLIGVLGWLYLASSDNRDGAGRAANAVMNAADRAIDSARSEERFREEEEPNYVNVGAIYTSNGHVRATLVVKGSEGVEAICNRIAYVRDFLVVLLSDFPPSKSNMAAGPDGYTGSVPAELNSLVEEEVVQSIRYDPYSLGQTGGKASC